MPASQALLEVGSPARMPELRWRAMACSAQVIVEGDSRLIETAVRRVADLEHRWSRFRPDSEVSKLNAATGPLVVSSETFDLLALCVRAWSLTGGRCDVTVQPAMIAVGYDRDLDELRAHPSAPRTPVPAVGADGLVLDAVTRSVTLLSGAGVDLGGIAKGHAAELVAGELVADGARAALVNLGGDLAVAGDPPDGGWPIEVSHPLQEGRSLTGLRIFDGAVATSSRARRHWRWRRRELHHLLDPASGLPTSGCLAATVLDSAGWRAEALATATMVAGPTRADSLLRARGARGIVVDDDCTWRWVGRPPVQP